MSNKYRIFMETAVMMAWQCASGGMVTETEMNDARGWVTAKFAGQLGAVSREPGLYVVMNHDPVQLNNRNGRPMRLGEQEYTRGLYCHAQSKIVVCLPQPGKSFSATVGVDWNENTSCGCGSVVFSATLGGKKVFDSGVMKPNTPAKQVQLDLADTREFTLEVGDAGDGIACDQADWADAEVELADGTSLWLADLPLKDAPTFSLFETDSFFSFVYGGKSFADICDSWKLDRAVRKLDGCRTERVLTYTDPETGLVVRCVGIEYLDFPTVEWTLYFKNTGDADTPILENIQALDIELGRPPKTYKYYEPDNLEFRLHHYVGGELSPRAYGPEMTVLRPRTETRFGGTSGRPSDKQMPYFNLQRPGDAGGLIIVVGWPGQWAAEFAREGDTRLHIRAGQELTHFKLLPGEEVRSPLIALQFWRGDRIDSQNVWRRWMIAHNMPRPGGQLPPIQLAAASSSQFHEMQDATAENQKLFIDRYLEEGLKLDYWWMDAGWYVCGEPPSWGKVGTWEVDTKRFPNGLREISDHAHSKGVKTIVWFEPERVSADTWLTKNHHEWVLGGEKGGILNLGNPDAWNWLVEHVDKLIVEQGIDLYRQDFNTGPLGRWRANDADDRQGITEIKHVTGYLAYWDELRRRHPNMLIDTCASGGRRNDLETLRRAVPLWRSDYGRGPVSQQCHTYGIAFWIPYHAQTEGRGSYGFRSAMYPQVTLHLDVRRRDFDYAEIRRFIEEWRQVAPNFYGDYYPLTSYNLEEDVWLAWQYNRPELGEGMVQVFRRSESPYQTAQFKLRGLESDATYAITDLDVQGETELSGRELMETGLPVIVTTSPSAVIITYKKVRMP